MTRKEGAVEGRDALQRLKMRIPMPFDRSGYWIIEYQLCHLGKLRDSLENSHKVCQFPNAKYLAFGTPKTTVQASSGILNVL